MHISNLLHAYMHPCIYLSKAVRKQNAYTRRSAAATTTTRHSYYTRSSKSKIMAEYEADNTVVRESLAQVQGEMNLFRGNMETILELLQSQRNPTSTAANVTRTTGMTIAVTAAGTTVDPPAESVVPNSGNLQMVPTDPARLAAAYPWGMPPHLAASLTSGGAFFPHSALTPAAGNSGFPWVLPALQTTLVIAADPEDNQGQVPDDLPNDEEDYRGPHLHFQLPSQTAQAASTGQIPVPFGYPGAGSVPMMMNPVFQYVQAGAPQAPNAQPGMQYFQPPTAAQTVAPGFSYSPIWFNPSVPALIAPEAFRPVS